MIYSSFQSPRVSIGFEITAVVNKFSKVLVHFIKARHEFIKCILREGRFYPLYLFFKIREVSPVDLTQSLSF